MTDSEKKWSENLDKATRKRKRSCGLHYTGIFKKNIEKEDT